MAVGRGKGDDHKLHYAVSTGNGQNLRWEPPVRALTFAADSGPALVGGTVLHSFYLRPESIDWITSSTQRQPEGPIDWIMAAAR